MSEKKSLVPTYTCAAGMLVGGLAGSTFGLLGKTESAVVAGFVAGCLLGSTLGSLLGFRLIRKKKSRQEKSKIESSGSG